MCEPFMWHKSGFQAQVEFCFAVCVRYPESAEPRNTVTKKDDGRSLNSWLCGAQRPAYLPQIYVITDFRGIMLENSYLPKYTAASHLIRFYWVSANSLTSREPQPNMNWETELEISML